MHNRRAGQPRLSGIFTLATSPSSWPRIISTGAFLLGPVWLSRALLAAASAGLVVLSAALAIRLASYRSSVAADIRAPERVFGFFTIVAGLDVLGLRLQAAGHPLATAILAGLAAVVWFVLTYGVPASLLAGERESVLGGVNGTWLLRVVSTQSLSVAASALVPAWPSQSGLLAPAAVGLWSVGLVLYLLLVTLILLRWLTVAISPATLGPAYWILMGATAITVLAGARILGLPATLPVTRATAGFVEGFSFALWAFGTWWIPLLILLGLWRHVRRRWPLRYEPALWSAVFPLGMYSVATLSFGQVARLDFMEPLGRFMLWVAVAAWVVVAVAALARLNQRSPVTRLLGYPRRTQGRRQPRYAPAVTAAANASRACRPKARNGPSGSLLSRRSTVPSVPAASTQLPPSVPEWLDVRHRTRSSRSRSIRPSLSR
jgi:tellurite resistance protein TehA-like permease